MDKTYKKILLLGSGGLSIGQAGEFDYSGNQAIKALLEESVHIIVINPNIATVQTNPSPNVSVYLYPLNVEWIKKVIEIERPEAIIASFGGQTALNCLLELESLGVLKSYGIESLGTSVQTLRLTEDRGLFAKAMEKIDIPIPPSQGCTSVEEAVSCVEKIGFPVIVRCAYALGGLGSDFAKDEHELKSIVSKALMHSPQVLVEKSLQGWKEIEYEIMRDRCDNSITICNMENFDPLGVHTGDSIVITPSQSLTDSEYQVLRNASLKIASKLGIVGECNAQFALCPDTSKFYIIEVNARLSRSSALASKASGYPIAYIAAKIILGYDLVSLKNPVTKITSAFYEPSLDYITVKIPRWDLAKFQKVSRSLGSAMKSVGEVMSIGRSFPEAFQKAVRMVKENALGISEDFFQTKPPSFFAEATLRPSDQRIEMIISWLRNHKTVEEVFAKTSVDKWFLSQLKIICDMENEIKKFFETHIHSKPWNQVISLISSESLKKWKQTGFADEQIAFILLNFIDKSSDINLSDISTKIRSHRINKNIRPVAKKIDTTSAEYPSFSNYYYFTYWGQVNDFIASDQSKKGVLILGGGAYRIGASVEFDWCGVSCSQRLKELGYDSIMINCNPETVSTDYNNCDRLYFEEPTVERILDISQLENTNQIITSMGGQLPNKLSKEFSQVGFKLLGHQPDAVEKAESRDVFSKILDTIGVSQPFWVSVSSKEKMEDFIKKVGFPVLIRPSYVLSGSAMKVAYNESSLERYLKVASEISSKHPVVVSQFITGARELDVDGVSQNGRVLINIVSEHIENAGIHSGDATSVVPAQRLYVETVRQIKKATRKIVSALCLNGPFNIQFLAKDNKILVIECNARAARSFPFVSKVTSVNLAYVATDVCLGHNPNLSYYNEDELSHVGVKAAVFSFSRLKGVDPVTGVEMASTGEVGCIAPNFEEALYLALLASKINPPKKGVLISSGPEKEKIKFLPAAAILKRLNIPMFATEGTYVFLKKHGYSVTKIPWLDKNARDIIKAMYNKDIDFVINIPKNLEESELTQGYLIRNASVEYGCSLFTNIEKAVSYLKSLEFFQSKNYVHRPLRLPEFL